LGRILQLEASKLISKTPKQNFAIKRIDTPQEFVDNLFDKLRLLNQLLGPKEFFASQDHPTIADISIGITMPILKELYPGEITEKMATWYERTCKQVPELKEVNEQTNYPAFFGRV